MAETDFDRRVANVRGFNRFYTRAIGVLHERLGKGPFSLAEARVLFELAQPETTTAGELGKALGLDPGYLSRILRTFEERGLLDRKASKADGRQRLLRLTLEGRRAFAQIDADARRDELDHRQAAGVGSSATGRGHGDDRELAAHSPASLPLPDSSSSARRHGLGGPTSRRALLARVRLGRCFEALVAEIVAQFLRNFDPKREHAWIAEMHGQAVGSVFLVKKSATTAKLRLLLVEPNARGYGIGSRLVDESVRFARAAGYRKVSLWTNHILHAARSIYEKAGFRLVNEEPHDHFGHGLIGQTWELVLQSPRPEKNPVTSDLKSQNRPATGRDRRRRASASRRGVKG